jgi:hypothetical protein
MMRGLKFIRILATIALSSLSVMAQIQQPSTGTDKGETSNSGAITGRVVNESGQPLPNAIVSFNPVGGGTSQSVATDREGDFSLEGLESKLSYHVYASMPAYTALPRDPRAGPPLTYRVGDSVTLTLTKGGVITGKVTNATGDPLVGILVRTEMVIRAPNGRRIANGQTRERETDDRGVYRIYGLPAGQYVVMAGGAGMSYSSANVDPFDTDVPTFAPSATRDTASEISVRSGEETTNIDITYRGEQGRTISGVVAGANDGYSVNLNAVRDGVLPWSGKSYPDMNGRSFSFVGMAEGDYDLYAYSYSNTREHSLSEVKRIRVRDADVTGIELTPRPLATVAGRVELEETTVPECTEKTRPLFEEMSISGWHNDTEAAKEIPQSIWGYGSPVKPDAQGNFLVRNLAPGEYSFNARLGGKNWYVRSIRFAAAAPKKPVDATRVWTNLKFGDRLSGLTVTLAQGGASFRGQLALGQGEEVPVRTFVSLAPVERERADNVLNYFGAAVTPDGKVAINGIPPGRYWIFAQTMPEDGPVPLARVRYPQETEIRAQIRRDGEAAKTEIEFKPCQNVVDFKLQLKPRDQ